MALATEARPGTDALEMLARAGYAARGVVYLIVGGFSVAAAFGGGGNTPDSRGALQKILGQTFGEVLLAIVAVGLVGYAVWRGVQAVLDADGHGTEVKGLVIRGGLLVSSLTHATLAWFAVSLLLGSGGGGSSSGAQEFTRWLMGQAFGPWLVGLVGVAIAGAGVAQVYKGWTEGFRKHMELGRARDWAVPVCRFGLMSRGVVFVIVGGLFGLAAVRANPSQAGGLKEAFDALQSQPYGWLLFGVIALGLAAFGVYSLLEAAYRRVELSHSESGRDAGRPVSLPRSHPRQI